MTPTIEYSYRQNVSVNKYICLVKILHFRDYPGGIGYHTSTVGNSS